MIYRGYTLLLKPTQEQNVRLEQFAGVCRLLWNLALEQRLNHWRQYQKVTGDNLNFYTQQTQLKYLRAEFSFIKDVSQQCQVHILQALDQAFKEAFKGTKGYPQFKKKGSNDSFTFSGREVTFERLNKRWGRVKLPKIGWVKVRLNRMPKGKFTEVTVSKTVLGWQVSIGTKVEGDLADNGQSVGIDRGVATPLMLSDGTAYFLPEQVELLDRKARKAQRIASKRKRGSRRQEKARRRVTQLRAKQARVRKHWAHTTTTTIAKNFGTVMIERLRTRDMTKSASGTKAQPGRNVAQKSGLNRSILNVGWYQIEQMLFYKAFKIVKVNPAYTSLTCSSCGTVDKEGRKNQASFVCRHCGFRCHADLNAAINIKNRGSTPVVEFGLSPNVETRTALAA